MELTFSNNWCGVSSKMLVNNIHVGYYQNQFSKMLHCKVNSQPLYLPNMEAWQNINNKIATKSYILNKSLNKTHSKDQIKII